MLTNIETSIVYFLNKTCKSEILDYIMLFFTALGNKKFIFALAIGLVFFKARKAKICGSLILVGLMFSYFLVHFLKHSIARPRPFLVVTDISIIDKAYDFSFPSGHATLAFLTAFIMAKCFQRRDVSYILYIIASCVAISRIYLGVHFLSDVFAGALIGIFLGAMMVYTAKRTGVLPTN